VCREKGGAVGGGRERETMYVCVCREEGESAGALARECLLLRERENARTRA